MSCCVEIIIHTWKTRRDIRVYFSTLLKRFLDAHVYLLGVEEPMSFSGCGNRNAPVNIVLDSKTAMRRIPNTHVEQTLNIFCSFLFFLYVDRSSHRLPGIDCELIGVGKSIWDSKCIFVAQRLYVCARPEYHDASNFTGRDKTNIQMMSYLIPIFKFDDLERSSHRHRSNRWCKNVFGEQRRKVRAP